MLMMPKCLFKQEVATVNTCCLTPYLDATHRRDQCMQLEELRPPDSTQIPHPCALCCDCLNFLRLLHTDCSPWLLACTTDRVCCSHLQLLDLQSRPCWSHSCHLCQACCCSGHLTACQQLGHCCSLGKTGMQISYRKPVNTRNIWLEGATF